MGKLQVLISTYGEEGMRRVASHAYPEMEGVEYIVSWQMPFGPVPEAVLGRSDMKVFSFVDKGLCRNRNHALECADAETVLIADDDVDYTVEGLAAVRKGFEEFPDREFLLFKFSCPPAPKYYPEHGYDLPPLSRGHYATSFEIAFRLDAWRKAGLAFDEDFGINGREFKSGEEDMLMADMATKGWRGRFIPTEICMHPTLTTALSALEDPDRARVKGAVLSRLHPLSWIPRLFVESWRNRRKGSRLNYLRYILLGLRGARAYRRR